MLKRKNYFLLILFGVFLNSIQAQQKLKVLPNLDSIKYLLTDMTIQIECTSGINDMYNFKFQRAESQFQWLKSYYPTHPLPYFLMALSQWWKIMPNTDNNEYDEIFISYLDSTIYFANQLYEENDKNVEVPFFLAVAYAFKGRIQAERSNWTRAAFATKKGLKYMEISRKYKKMSPEILFGEGLYNYYSIWVRENYPTLKPILWFFAKGDKELGISQLETVVKESFYSKVEAQYYLMQIYNSERKYSMKSFPIAQYLHQTYPDNPFFHRYYARMLYTTGKYIEMERVAIDIINRIEKKNTGYEAVSGRYAGFYLGSFYKHKDKIKSKDYFEKAVNYAEEVNAFSSGYYLHSLSNLANFAKNDNNFDEAMAYFDKILRNANKKHSTYKSAKGFKKEYKRQLKEKK